MKKIVFKLLLFMVIVGLTAGTACKSGDKGFDITEGTWGIFLETPAGSNALVYDFQGNKESGEVYYRNQERGTYRVSGSNVSFTVNHFDEQDNLFLYVYSGAVADDFNMSGSFTVTNPDGTVTNGNWTALR
jgi:hypothetical protein